MVDDFDFGFTHFYDFCCLEPNLSQESCGALHEFFSFLSSFLFHFGDVRHKVRNHVNGDIAANWFDDMQNSNRSPFASELSGDCPHG